MVVATAGLASAADDCGAANSLRDVLTKYSVVPQEYPENRRLAFHVAGLVDPSCTPLGVANFRPSCRAHDACYDVPNQNKSDCDDDFRSSLSRSCRNTYRARGWRWLFKATGSLDRCRTQCLGVANMMYQAVHHAAGDAFDAAQSSATLREQGRRRENARMFVPLL
jgi:hypothetical protein